MTCAEKKRNTVNIIYVLLTKRTVEKCKLKPKMYRNIKIN